jgi:predicted O-linked N-acetylglucosamine transferase (SPINDLY family)
VARKPDFHEGWDNLAYCLKTQDRLAEAVACHEKAVAFKPGYAIGWFNFGLTLSLLGRETEALACHERALAADPNYALARYGRAQALHQMHRLEEAVADYGWFLEQKPDHHEARSYRLFALHNLDRITPGQLFEEHVAFGRAVAVNPPPSAPPRNPDPARPLRVAVLSPDLRAHSCASFLEPLLRHLDRKNFELYLYHDHFREDAVSQRLKTHAAVWRNVIRQPGPALEKIIRADAPDILIDLAGHTGMTNRLPLFARRLALVQVTYLGYPNTTGLAAMDYRFTDEIADPIGEADRLATETLVRFAPTAWAYQPPAEAPQPVEPPCLQRGAVTFGCFNNLAKISDATIALWARVLAAVPGSRLLLKGRGLGDEAVRARYLARFERLGLPAARVEWLERTAGAAEHFALYGRVDIALDTFRYHGTTTTCEALWMGVPVVTLAGDCHMARVGSSLLTAIGRPEWIARHADDYVRIASRLAADPAHLVRMRRDLRATLQTSPLLDHAGQAARFGAALRSCWVARCVRAAAAA